MKTRPCHEPEQVTGQQRDTLEYAGNILETVREPLITLDTELRILSASASFYATFDLAPEATIGTVIFDLADHQWDIPGLRQLFTDILTNTTAITDYEIEHVFQGIGRKIFLLNARRIFLKDTGLHTILVAMEDITEKRHLTEQLTHSQKLETIGELAGGLAHDMNNLLSVINGYATMTAQALQGDAKLLGYINQILSASTRAASLSQSLLAYSRKQSQSQRNYHLKTLVEKVGAFIKRILLENIEFTLSLTDEPLMVCVDATQFDQVLLNLATNARDVMPEGGTLKISTCSRVIDDNFIATRGIGEIGRYAVIAVSDTGLGMDAQTRSRIFDPFFTTKDIGKGTGLGLSIVMRILSQHGGFIDLESQPGEGSVFRIYLPLVETGQVSASLAATPFPKEKSSGTVLVAEDDFDTRIAIEKFLTQAGYTVITAFDGQELVEKFAACKDKIQLVLSDVIMPKKSGLAACNEIRQLSPHTRFLFVSGHTRNIIKREGDLPADVELVMKPIKPLELMAKISEIIRC